MARYTVTYKHAVFTRPIYVLPKCHASQPSFSFLLSSIFFPEEELQQYLPCPGKVLSRKLFPALTPAGCSAS